MLAADDGNPQTMAKMYEVKILWDDPADSEGQRVYDTMMPIVRSTFLRRGSKADNMNGRSKCPAHSAPTCASRSIKPARCTCTARATG